MKRAVRQPRAVVSPEPDLRTRANLWGRRHAARDTSWEYPADQLGKPAFDGEILDIVIDGLALASAWREPDSAACWRPAYRPLGHRRLWTACKPHPGRHLTVVQPYAVPDMGPEERFLAELRDWPPIATRERIRGRYRSLSFETSDPTSHLEVARDFAEYGEARGDANALVLAGPTGRGKTHDAICAFRRLALWHSDSDRARYVFTQDLIAACVKPDPADDVPLIEQCLEAELLLLDGLGEGFAKDGGLAEAQVERLIVEREAEDLETIITTNLTMGQIGERLGDRIASRLGGEWALWVDCLGPDLRSHRR